MTQNHPSPWNLPNAITVARILLVPLFIWQALNLPLSTPMGWWAVGVFTLAMATDGVDGAIARRRGLITNLGKILDPIADKALTGAGFILLAYYAIVPWWAVVLILVREIGITVYRLAIAHKRVIAASGGGKFKTIVQAVVIPLLLSPLAQSYGFFLVFGLSLFWIAVVLTIYSGAQYVVAAIRAPRA